MRKNIALFIVFALCSLSSAFAQINYQEDPYIEVTGVAEKEILPDEIYLSITIDEEKSKQTLTVLEKKLQKAVSDQGIDLKNLTVVDAYSELDEGFWSNKIQSKKSYQLKVSTAKETALIIRELNKQGIAQVRLQRVDHSELEKFKLELKVEAIKSAQAKAKLLLEAINCKAGKPLRVIERDNYYQPVMMSYQKRGVASAEEANFPEIEFKKITLKYTVEARFAIE